LFTLLEQLEKGRNCRIKDGINFTRFVIRYGLWSMKSMKIPETNGGKLSRDLVFF